MPESSAPTPVGDTRADTEPPQMHGRHNRRRAYNGEYLGPNLGLFLRAQLLLREVELLHPTATRPPQEAFVCSESFAIKMTNHDEHTTERHAPKAAALGIHATGATYGNRRAAGARRRVLLATRLGTHRKLPLEPGEAARRPMRRCGRLRDGPTLDPPAARTSGARANLASPLGYANGIPQPIFCRSSSRYIHPRITESAKSNTVLICESLHRGARTSRPSQFVVHHRVAARDTSRHNSKLCHPLRLLPICVQIVKQQK